MRKPRVVVAGIGLAAVLTTLAACGNGPPADQTAAASSAGGAAAGKVVTNPTGPIGATVGAGDSPLVFTPATVSVKTGDTVKWTNSGSAPHTITFDTQDSLSDATFKPGDTYAVTFTAAGKYTYKCTIHPGMDGEVDVK